MVKKKKVKKEKKEKKSKIKIKKVVQQKAGKKPSYRQSVFKANEDKVKIKKILKQPTEKKEYNVKDYVVYPKHGVGKILSIDKAKIGNIDIMVMNILYLLVFNLMVQVYLNF